MLITYRDLAAPHYIPYRRSNVFTQNSNIVDAGSTSTTNCNIRCSGGTCGANRAHVGRLDASINAQDMAVPGWRLYPLKGQRKGAFSVDVSGNVRLTFRFDGEHAVDVDLEDYH